jgi:hypothetical protein
MATKQTLTRYKYSGPQSGVTLKLQPGGDELEVQLLDGREIPLPADHPFVRKLKLKGFLTEVVPAKRPVVVPDPPAPKAEKQKASATVKEDSPNAG